MATLLGWCDSKSDVLSIKTTHGTCFQRWRFLCCQVSQFASFLRKCTAVCYSTRTLQVILDQYSASHTSGPVFVDFHDIRFGEFLLTTSCRIFRSWNLLCGEYGCVSLALFLAGRLSSKYLITALKTIHVFSSIYSYQHLIET